MICKRGFTLIEFLVVVTIIAILIAIVIPAVKAARASSDAATCMMNLRQLGVGMMSFGADHGGRLPGNHTNFGGHDYDNSVEAYSGGTTDLYAAGGKLEVNGRDPATGTGNTVTKYHGTQEVGQYILKRPEYGWMGDWLCGMERGYNGKDPTQSAYNDTNKALRGGFYSQPTRGTMYPYVNTIKAYRCPTLPNVKINGGANFSNGQYEYTMVNYLNGSRVDRVARQSQAKFPGFTTTLNLATPVILEEDPGNNLNKCDAGTDGAWCNSDMASLNHKGGTNIMTLDGSAYWYITPPGFRVQAYYMIIPSIAPGRKSVPNGSGGAAFTDNTPYGWYNVN